VALTARSRLLPKIWSSQDSSIDQSMVGQLEETIDRLAQQGVVTYPAIAEQLNKNGPLRRSGRPWHFRAVHRALRKMGRTRTAWRYARREQIKRALNGIVRQGGIVGAQAIAERLNEKGVPTMSSKGKWTKKMVGTLYRRLGRRLKRPPFWNKTRVARVVKLRQAGETWAAIAEEFVEYEITAGAVRAVWYKVKRTGAG
jgi:hypothetical protein